MASLSAHFFEDSSISRMAVGNVLYMCVLLTYSHEFVRNNTAPQAVQKREADSGSIGDEFKKLIDNLPTMKTEECFEQIPPLLLSACNSTDTFELEECDRFVNNGVWDLCQSLDGFDRCNDILYEYSTDDYFRHPGFWGGCGFLIGIILSLIAIIIGSCICAMCCKKKNSGKGIAGSGSASVEGGKASKVTSSDTKNSSEDKNGAKGATVKPSVPQSQYCGDQFPADGGKKSVFIGAKTTRQPVDKTKNQTMARPVNNNKTMAKSVRDNKKKRKNKYGKEVGALTAMEVTMYK